MIAGTHQLYITGFNDEGWTGTIKDKNGKPIYNIDADNLIREGGIMNNNSILAVDDLDVILKPYNVTQVKQNQPVQGEVNLFDVSFSVKVESKLEPVVKIRLNEEQARKLKDLLDTRILELTA